MNIGKETDDRDIFVSTTETRHGKFFYLTLDDPIGVSLSHYGEWAQLEINFLNAFIRPGDHIIDLGANIGTHSIAWAQQVQVSGHILALEPQPKIADLLKRNVEENGHGNVVQIMNCAIDRKVGELTLGIPDYYKHHNSGASSVNEQHDAKLSVPAITLDSLQLKQCDLIKLDIEGWEYDALLGGTELLQRFEPLVYAECNCIETGWNLIQLLSSMGYKAYLHSPPAFSKLNYKKNKNNLFGLARESNLFFFTTQHPRVHSFAFQREPYLTPVATLDQLACQLTSILRYGEQAISPVKGLALARRLQVMQGSNVSNLSSTESRKVSLIALKKLVCVLVPIYNGFYSLEDLFDSILNAYPEPVENLLFFFVNDASTDGMVQSFLQQDKFKREDFFVHQSEKNQGFVKTVNWGFAHILKHFPDADVTLLNSDTIIPINLFARLQDASVYEENIASVTPVTNNGTIASLFTWPHGDNIPNCLTLNELFAAFENIFPAASAPAQIPTGVGFCMYITNQALTQVGSFSAVFGIGYGEENDWCERAKKLGLKHMLDLSVFVYHRGSQSFGVQTKNEQLQKNMAVLREMHPEYFDHVGKFIDSDPLCQYRLNRIWQIRSHVKKERNLHTFLQIVHHDPLYYGGGTEKHVQGITETLLIDGNAEVFQLFPTNEGQQWILRAYLPSKQDLDDFEPFCEFPIAREQLDAFLRTFALQTDTIHVHHWLNWPQSMVQSIQKYFEHAYKVMTLHDYYSICPSIRLLPDGSFCQVPAQVSSCNNCLHKKLHQNTQSIVAYRKKSYELLDLFDKIVTPSSAARNILVKGFQNLPYPNQKTQHFLDRIEVLSNFLPRSNNQLKDSKKSNPKPVDLARPRIVFLGGFCESKGSKLFSKTAEAMADSDCIFEIWGNIGDVVAQTIEHREYQTDEQLRLLACTYPAAITVLPSLWPETFSFTTFEALLDIGSPVIVGPFGNPATLVEKFHVGEVLTMLTEQVLEEKIKVILANYNRYRQAVLSAQGKLEYPSVYDYIDEIYPARDQLNTVRAQLPLPSINPEQALEYFSQSNRNTGHSLQLRHVFVNHLNQSIKIKSPFLHRTTKYIVSKFLGLGQGSRKSTKPLRYQFIDSLNFKTKQFSPGMHALTKKLIQLTKQREANS